jgi:hypothetical protein
MKEPIDFDRWSEEESYRVETARAVLDHLKTMDSYKDKVWYLDSIGLNPSRSYRIYPDGCKPKNDGIFYDYIDQYGNDIEPVLTIYLRGEPITDEQRSELNKALFSYYKESNHQRSKEKSKHDSSYGITKPISELITDYWTRYELSPLKSNFIKGELTRVSEKINQLPATPKKAAKIAYDSIIYVKLINWINVSVWEIGGIDWHLSLVWDLVEYQIFLEQRVEELAQPLTVVREITSPVRSYNLNYGFSRGKAFNLSIPGRIVDKENNVYQNIIPDAEMKILLQFIKTTPQPFTISQLKGYMANNQSIEWYEATLDEAVRCSLIELQKNNNLFNVRIITEYYIENTVSLSNKIGKTTILEIINEAEQQVNEGLEKLKTKLKDSLSLKKSNEKILFLEDCRSGFVEYYTDLENPLHQYQVEDLTKLVEILSNTYTITIPYTFWTNDPTKCIEDIILNGIANKLLLRKIIQFFTNEIEKLEQNTTNSQSIKFEIPPLSQIFWADAIPVFETIEKELWVNGFFNEDGSWKKKTKSTNLTDLVKLILLLEKYKYFKKVNQQGKQLKDVHIRAFFEKRYNCNINQQFSDRRNHNVDMIPQLFPFIKPFNS